MMARDGAGPKLTELKLSMQGSETDGGIADNDPITRELMDCIIDLIDAENFESALSVCEDVGLCAQCGEASSLDRQCLPIKLLEASLTTHRHNAYEAYLKLKEYLGDNCRSYQAIDRCPV